jgi:hypothetical protein
MVYKKYIKRNGKVYGPYIYHSKRVGDKVVSEYRGGLKKPRKYFNLLIILSSIILVGILVFLLVSSQESVSGQATLDLNANYKPGETLKGKLDLSLKEGELIPANSKLVIENNENVKEFKLKEVVSRELSEGDFYIQGESIPGSGEGYGKQGFSEKYQDVYFELNVYAKESTEEEPKEVQEPDESEAEEEIEEVVEESEESTEEESQETIEPEQAEEEPEEVVEESEESTEEELKEVQEPEEVENNEDEELESSPVTGNFFVRLTGMFFGLTPTGQATLELEKTVEGKVSFGEEFVYELQPGETAELKPLSVKTSSGEELEDNKIKVKIENNKVIVTTNYNEREKGYGEEFLGEGLVKLSINLNDLDLDVQEGTLKIKIVYEEENLLAVETSLTEGEVIGEEIVEEPEEEQEELEEIFEELNESEINMTKQLNETINKTFSIRGVEPLSIQEKALLINYFGDVPIELVKSELFKDRFIVGYKLGKYEVEFSYDSSISPELLKVVMENDRVIWLRDLSKSLDSSETLGKEVNLSEFINESFNLTY